MVDPFWQKLQQLGIAGKPLGADHYQAGSSLMEYVNYLGCSPSLRSGDIESTLRIHRFDQPAAMGGDSVDAIRYPVCKHRLADASDLLRAYPARTTWQCPECGNQGTLDQINWRKSAGFAQLFLEISAIFPKEAIPTDKLLAVLHELCGCDWTWFYSRASD
ncbi:MAG: hypothetical protein QNJ69_15055 [Gammaproteobacteria bacterium]|nr:hypothetical protein [Gammaproteobacteria bacterium]